MKKIYLAFAVCMAMACNTAHAGSVTYTDYGVTNEATLDSALIDPAPDAKRIDIDSNINLQNNLSSPVDIPVIINGNNNTINGAGKAGLVTPEKYTTTINDLTLTNFVAPFRLIGTDNWTLGGAISNQTGTINIFNSHFTNNIADGSITTTAGGAIDNRDYTTFGSAGVVNIYNSFFENNKAGINVIGQGGAIYNDGTMNIYNSAFTKNTIPTFDFTSAGGAISNHGILTVYNSTFGTDNVDGANSATKGGAISNDGVLATASIYNSTFKNNSAFLGGAIYNNGNLKIYDSTFTSNTTSTFGGAICNEGTAYVIADKSDVKFTANTSSNYGGAIYNNKNLYLIANNGGINFTGNTAPSSGGNDVFNGSSGKIYLNAGLGDITFNGGISSDGGGIYINSPVSTVDGLTVPTTGRVILNSELMAPSGSSINLYDGMLKIVNNASDKTGALNVSQLNMQGTSTLNLADGFVNSNVLVGMLNASGTSNIWMDANLNSISPSADYLSVGTWGSMPLPKFTFRVLNDEASSGKISITNVPFDLSSASSIAYTNHYKYTFTGTAADTPSGFTFVRSGNGTTYDGLATATADTAANRSFSLVDGPYFATSNLTPLSHGTDAASTKTLTVFGTGKNGLAISGNSNNTLFNVPQYAQLNIVDAVLKNASGWDSNGAAINNSGTLNVYDSLFDTNKSNRLVSWNIYGGAIYNSGTAYITNSDFTNNLSHIYGGAIANSGADATMNIFHSNFTKNTTNNNIGGAIHNSNGATLNIADSTFGGDDFSFANSSGIAGAICNNANANIYNSTFKFNRTTASNGEGGAIYNSGIANIYNSTFVNNNATYGHGGAISNHSGTLSLYNSTFTNNIAGDLGGAIYSDSGTVNLIASGQDVTFSGNTATIGGNDIYLTGGSKLNLNAALGNKISFGGGIKSSAITDGTININKAGSATAGDPPTGAPVTGEIILGAPIETSTVNMYSGTLTLNNDSYLNGNNLNLSGGTLNMQNGAVGTMSLNNLAVTGNTNLKIDANLATGTSDKIDGTYGTSSSKLTVSSIKLLNDSATSSTTTQLLGAGLVGHDLVTMGVTKAYTPIYQYNISYDDTTGKLAFAGGSSGGSQSFNPAVLSSPVSANVGAYMTQISTYNEALSRSELFMSLPQQERLLMKQRNMYANVGGSDVQPEVFSPTFLPDERGGLWFKQYTSFENVPLNNGPNVSNIGYGALVGADSPMYHLKNGYDGYVTAYVGYNGSHQNYDNVGVNQNGGALGLTGTLYKGNFFTALTASIGESVGQANTMYGTDNFNTLLAGLAWKSGYNFEMMRGKLILQPSLLAAYTFANTFNYTTASGVNVTSDPLNAIQIAPGVKLIANLKNGWQPYLATNMVFNIMDNQKFYANDAQLPQMSIAPYVEYGIGVQRRWGERFTGFGQAMLRGGGRNGIALQFGFRIAIGK